MLSQLDLMEMEKKADQGKFSDLESSNKKINILFLKISLLNANNLKVN